METHTSPNNLKIKYTIINHHTHIIQIGNPCGMPLYKSATIRNNGEHTRDIQPDAGWDVGLIGIE
jgi:hypothetical protein